MISQLIDIYGLPKIRLVHSANYHKFLLSTSAGLVIPSLEVITPRYSYASRGNDEQSPNMSFTLYAYINLNLFSYLVNRISSNVDIFQQRTLNGNIETVFSGKLSSIDFSDSIIKVDLEG